MARQLLIIIHFNWLFFPEYNREWYIGVEANTKSTYPYSFSGFDDVCYASYS